MLQVQRLNRELWAALAAVVAITLVYLFVSIYWANVPEASSLFGHGIGIAGFILMLMTESLYSIRKRMRRANWGRMSAWLQFHIFTGLVGPFMVLLHSSWKFNGLAGIVMLLTVVIVASGFIGRYIYTSIPRTIDGVEIEEHILESEITALEVEIQKRQKSGSDRKIESKELRQLVKRRRAIQRQIRSLAFSRRMMALWHTVHIPVGLALFSAAFIHIVAAVYYATLLR
jgi:hypothetical protein